MRILGIDYGRKKVGLALAETDSSLAEPLKVIRFQDFKILVAELEGIINKSGIEKLVIGVSEGVMAEETKKFGKKLEEQFKIPVVFQDETLTTQEAQELSIKAGVKRKRRKEMEDAYSATLILQDYLDNKGQFI